MIEPDRTRLTGLLFYGTPSPKGWRAAFLYSFLFEEMGYTNVLSHSLFEELGYTNVLSHSLFEELGYTNVLSHSLFEELGYTNVLLCSSFKQMDYTNVLLYSSFKDRVLIFIRMNPQMTIAVCRIRTQSFSSP